MNGSHSVSQLVPQNDRFFCPIRVWTSNKRGRGSPRFIPWRRCARQRGGSLTLLNWTVEPKQKAQLGSAGQHLAIQPRPSTTPNTTSPYWLISLTRSWAKLRERRDICSRPIPIWAVRYEPVGRSGVPNGLRL